AGGFSRPGARRPRRGGRQGMRTRISRRALLAGAASLGLVAVPRLAACGPPAAPTAAPKAEAPPAKTAETPASKAEAPPAKATVAPASQPPAAAAKKTLISWQDVTNAIELAAVEYNKAHPNVEVSIEMAGADTTEKLKA